MIVVENETRPLNDFTPQELNHLAWVHSPLTNNNHNDKNAETTSNGSNDGNRNDFHLAHHHVANEVSNRRTCVSSQVISTTSWRFDNLGHDAANPKSLPLFVKTQRDDDDSMKQIVEM